MKTNLLTDRLGSGYPLEYLAARLRGRLAGPSAAPPELTRSAPDVQAPTQDDFIDQEVKKKRFWLYAQMDEATRALLQPVYLYSEISSFFHLLRLRQGREKIHKNMLADSVLPKNLVKSFWRTDNVADCLKVLESHLAPILRPHIKVAALYASEGLAKTEEMVLEAILLWGAGEKKHPAVSLALSKITDAYNCRKAVKWLRWDIKQACTFVSGGKLCTMRLRRLIRHQDLNGLENYSRQADLGPIRQNGGWPIEEAVLASLRSRVREQDNVAIVLFYFWSVQVEAKQWRRGGRHSPTIQSLSKEAAA